MDFQLPQEITAKLAELDAFINSQIKPLEAENMQFFDHRREYARTDWANDGRPQPAWRALIEEMERRADKAGHLRLGLPKSCGGQAAPNLMIAAIREHLAGKGLGLHNDCRTSPRSSAAFRSFRCAVLMPSAHAIDRRHGMDGAFRSCRPLPRRNDVAKT